MFDQYANINGFNIRMESLVIKKQVRKWPSLEKLLEVSRRIKQESYIDELLQPIPHLNLRNVDNISEISDIFEEFHQESFLKRQNGDVKYLMKHEADIKTMEGYTEDYKNVMNEMRQEMDNKPLCSEIFEELESEFNKSGNKSDEYDETGERRRVSLDVIDIPESNSDKKESIASVESAVWNVIDAHIRSKTFQVSPIGYNAFEEGKHWLERPEVKWETMNNSKLKVEKWLKEIEE